MRPTKACHIGTEKTKEGNIQLPKGICVLSTCEVTDIEKLSNHVFRALYHNMANLGYMTSRAILSTKNDKYCCAGWLQAAEEFVGRLAKIS
jgi:hypothetical protein